MDKKLLMHLPNLKPEEASLLSEITRGMTEGELSNFVSIYKGKRKDPQTMLIFTLIGFLGLAGVQRFVMEDIGMGILYFFTGGLCWIGTIIDLINNDKITTNYNRKKAVEASNMVMLLQENNYTDDIRRSDDLAQRYLKDDDY